MKKIIGTKIDLLSFLLQNEDTKTKYELSEYKDKRSLNANAYFHVLVNKLADVLNKSNQEMKIELNLKYGTLARAEDGKIMGCMIPKYVDIKAFYEYAECYKEDSEYEYYMFYKRTSELNSKEFARLLEGTVQECKQQDIETLDEIEIKRLIDEIDNTKERK